MSQKESIKLFCRLKNIKISKLEKDLGFSNGYINSINEEKGAPIERLLKIADYLEITIFDIDPEIPFNLDKSSSNYYQRDNDRIPKHSYYIGNTEIDVMTNDFTEKTTSEIVSYAYMLARLSKEEKDAILTIIKRLSDKNKNLETEMGTKI